MTTGIEEKNLTKVLSGSRDSRVASAGAPRAGLGPLPRLCHGAGRARRGTDEEDKPAYIDKWIAWGAGPRAGQALVLAAKARAALDGRTSVTIEDIRAWPTRCCATAW